MADNRTTNVIRNIFTGFIGKFVNILLPFVIRTVIINVFGTEYLGLNSLFSSIFNMLNLTEFGFSSALIYQMYKPAAQNNTEELSLLLGIYRKIYHLISVVMTILGLILMPFLPHLINGSCPDNVNIYYVYIMYLINTVIPYYTFGYRVSILLAYQRADIQNIVNMLIVLGMNIAQIVLMLISHNYYTYVIALPIFTFVNNAIIYFITKSKYKEIIPIDTYSKERLKSITKNAGAVFGHKLNYIIVSAADSIVISSFLGLTVLAKYSNYYTVLSAVIGLIDVVFNSMVSSVGNLLVGGDEEKNLSTFNLLLYIQYWIVCWCTVCLVCLYQDFMIIWMGTDMLLPFGTIILFGMYLYTFKMRSVILLYKDAAGMWKNDMLKPYVAAVVNLVLNIILVNFIGVNGVLISTIVSFLVVSFPWESKIVFSQLFHNSAKQYVCMSIKYAIICIIDVFLTYKLCNIVTYSITIKFTIKVMMCVIIPNILFFILTFKTKEFSSFKHYILTFMRKDR